MSSRRLSRRLEAVGLLVILLSLPLFGGGVAATGEAPLVLEKAIVLAGVSGRIDHLALDVAGQRLLVAALGNNTLEVLDLKAGKRLRTIKGLNEPQDVLYLADSNKIFVTTGGDGTLRVFDGNSFNLLNTINFSEDADNLRYDPKAGQIFVGYGTGALGLVEAGTGQRLGDVKLAGHPEAFQLEQAGPRIYVNVPTAGQVAVVDRQQIKVTATWPLKGARQNFPMALDEANRRLFIGCRNPARIIIYDTRAGKPLGALNIAGDVDDLFYEAQSKRLYAACGAGFLEVFQQTVPDHYISIARVPTARGARTCLLAPEQRRLYLAVPQRAGQPAEIRIYRVEP